MNFGDALHYPLLTAMLAPALFLTACGSLLLNANNRLARISDRLREVLLAVLPGGQENPHAERIDVLRRRAHLILRAIRLLHLAICLFVGTSLCIGIDAAAQLHQPLLPTALAVLGVSMMLAGTLSMWREAGLAVESLELMVSALHPPNANGVRREDEAHP
jgi:hypothetical protein